MTQDFLERKDVALIHHEVACEGVQESMTSLPLWQLNGRVLQRASEGRVQYLNGPYIRQCALTLSARFGGIIGTCHTFPELVLAYVTTLPWSRCAGSFSVSDHRAPVARQSNVTSSGVGVATAAEGFEMFADPLGSQI